MTHVSQWNWKERMGQLADVVKATTRERQFLNALAHAVLTYDDPSDVRDRFAHRGVGYSTADFYKKLLAQVGLDEVLEMTRAYNDVVRESGYPVFPDDVEVDENKVPMFWRERDFNVSDHAFLQLLQNPSELNLLKKQLIGFRKVDSEIRRTLKPERKRKGL